MQKRNLYLRRAVFAVLAAAVGCIQFALGDSLSIASASPMLLLPLLISISMNENAFFSVLIGAFAGVFVDMFSISEDGFFGVAFAVCSFAASSLVIFTFRRTFAAAVIFTAFSSVAVNVLYWFFFVALKGYGGMFSLLLSKYIPGAFYTFFFILVFYPLTGLVCRLTSERSKTNEG